MTTIEEEILDDTRYKTLSEIRFAIYYATENDTLDATSRGTFNATRHAIRNAINSEVARGY